LVDFGNDPPIISYIKSIISKNYFNYQKNKGNEEIERIKHLKKY
jgi:hypothetical protein